MAPRIRIFLPSFTKIIATKPDFIFVPDNYNQVALIVPQARKLGYTGEFMVQTPGPSGVDDLVW